MLLSQMLDFLAARPLYTLVGYGPLYRGEMCYRPNVIPLREVQVNRFFSGIDYAISASGYNTYQELLCAGVPTLFYATARGWDQQDRRLEEGLKAGWHGALKAFDPQSLEAGLSFLAQEAQNLRSRLQRDWSQPQGARKGAEAIVSLWQEFSRHPDGQELPPLEQALRKIEWSRMLHKAALYQAQKPLTLTEFSCPHSPGTAQDFYSEADYWWPQSDQPAAPYQRRDGLSNPDNFNDHRQALIRCSEIVGCLTSAWLLTHKPSYAEQAGRHLQAWFADPKPA